MFKPFDRKKALQRITAICRKAVAAHGYDAHGRTWKVVTESFVRVINLQTHRKDDLSHLRFTFNVGVFFPEIFLAQQGDLPEPPIQEAHCCPRERLGKQVGGPEHWWEVDRNTDSQALTADLTETLTQHAIPWLAQFETMEDVFGYLCRRKQPFEAAVVAYALRRDDVAQLIRNAIVAAPHDIAARGIEIWARDHGIAGYTQ